jgi:predicted acetyltransferase
MVFKPLHAASRDGASVEIGAEVPADLRSGLESFLRYRLAQLAVDSSIREWLGRAMILTDRGGSRRVIGTIGFHGPPDEQQRLEIGYSVHAPYRRQGYASEAVRAMLDWAASEHGVSRFVASVSPTNEASLNLVRGFGFTPTGEQDLHERHRHRDELEARGADRRNRAGLSRHAVFDAPETPAGRAW